MDEQQALKMLDEQLEAAFRGLTAPASFDAAVRARLRQPRVTGAPEILDWIGWAASVTIAAVLAACFGPAFLNANALIAMTSVLVLATVWFGFRSVRDSAL